MSVHVGRSASATPPPHPCGGPVEARRGAYGQRVRLRPPPHPCGGPVEAISAGGYVLTMQTTLRRIRAAAPLKPRAPILVDIGQAPSPASVPRPPRSPLLPCRTVPPPPRPP